jgi:serine/threonine protein kinase
MLSVCANLQVLLLARIAHRDLKPANFMYHAQTSSVTLIDFGVSRTIPAQEHVLMHTFAGNLHTISPQVLAQEERQVGYSWKCDLWSVGCILFYVLTGEHLVEKMVQQ